MSRPRMVTKHQSLTMYAPFGPEEGGGKTRVGMGEAL